MSSHACLLDELAKMEGNELTKDQRIEILRNYFSGFGTKTRQQIGLDLNTKDYLHFDHFVNKWQGAVNLHEVDMGEILESGIIPMPLEYKHNSRDRRWTAGWLFDTIEVVRQQGYTKLLFEGSYHDINNNDLLKVRELSGTFWRWDGNPRNIGSAIELFSGMIQPSQKITDNPHDLKATVRIISSFNGLWNEDFDQIYFLPKGETPTVGNFFKVMSVKVGDGRFLTQDEANSLSEKWNEEEWGELFQEEDFAIIKVRNLAADGTNTLRKFLQDNNLLNGHQVVSLQGDFDGDFEPNRIFAFGKPSSNLKMDSFDENGFCLVSDTGDAETVEKLGDRLENQTPFHLIEPLRKLKDSSKIYDQKSKTDPVAPKITALKGNIQSAPIPFATGMNGGPVLVCKASGSAPFQIKCKFIGVVRGGGLIQDASDKVSYKGLVSVSPYLSKPFFADSWNDIRDNLVQMNWEEHWSQALELMEVPPPGSPHELTEAQRTKVLERLVRGRGKTHGLSLADDLAQTNLNAGVQIATDLNTINFLDNPIHPKINMKKAFELGITKIPYRDRRLAAGVIFSAMDIARQQAFTNPLFNISRDNPDRNDLALVRKLSGTFWNWNASSQTFIRAAEQFSGMIQTSQEINGTTVNILSCVHGIEGERIENIYFLPKGKTPHPENFFQVKSFQIGSDKQPRLTDTTGVNSLHDDYAIIQVSNASVQGGHTLSGFLHSEGLLDGTKVVPLKGEAESTFEPDRIFAFGKPGAKFLKDASLDVNGFCLVVDTFAGNLVEATENARHPSTLIVKPLRKLTDPNQIYQTTPTPATSPATSKTFPLGANEYPLPLYGSPGMSGGPILACKIDDASSVPQIKCMHFGVVQGFSLTREPSGKVFYRGLIALPRPDHGNP
ncbi:MAG: hypothetical protein K2Q34_03805 [Alphaproteobacteria bacterium]|nr:hypothetical protein [Alphaproteobacteria bacterium]